MADHRRGVERRTPLGWGERDVRRGCREPVVVQQGAHVARVSAEVARELDFPVPGRGDARDGPVEIFFHLVTHRIQL